MSFTGNSKVLVATLDGYKLLQTAKRKTDEAGAVSYFYEYNGNNRYDMIRITKAKENYDDCAYFYQFSKLLGEDSVTNHMFFVEFSGAYGGSLFDDEKNRAKLHDLFLHGIVISFDGKKRVFKPGDKSDSMSRQGRISFLDVDYMEALDKRLNLVYEDESAKPQYKKYNEMIKNPLFLSKYFSYKGKYLSTGQRVNHKDFVINDETVIVLPNMYFKKIKHVDMITAKKVNDSDDRKTKWEVVEKTDDFLIEQVYDGEGIISPEYAGYINEALGLQQASSFQIRMPYVKGMLHEVDFHGFIREFARLEDEAPYYKEGDSYYIKDIFGRVRDLSKAHILLEQSMFKILSFGFVSALPPEGEKQNPEKMYAKEDFADWYFSGIKNYDHGMYVINTNPSINPEEKKVSKLNYQILNPLALDEEAVEKLVLNQEKYVEDPVLYLRESGSLRQLQNWQELLLKYPALQKDKYINGQLKGIQKKLISDIALGRVRVPGEYRFLSRDLLPFLKRLIRRLTDATGTPIGFDVFKHPALAPIGRDSFYMPAEGIGLQPHMPCAFFRNPHLSRNEECVLKSFDVKPGSVYDRYLSHLTGVVMIPHDSLTAHILGGADFDGDEVNVVSDASVVNAVLEGCYEKKEEGSLERKLPIVVIPSAPSASYEYSDERLFQIVGNTFSNQIGEISNAAIRIGQSQYLSEDYSDYNRSCQACTVLTGLEIDAAKSGKHPDLSTILSKDCGKDSAGFDYIRDIKSLAEEEKSRNARYHVSLSENGVYEVKTGAKDKKPLKTFSVEDLQKNGTPLAKLSYHYLKMAQKHRGLKKVDQNLPIKRMEENELSGLVSGKVSAVIKAYDDVLKLDRKINRLHASFIRDKHADRIETILRLQYDAEINDEMRESMNDAQEIILAAYVGQNFGDEKTAVERINDSIREMSAQRWNYLMADRDKKGAIKMILPRMREEQTDALIQIFSNFNHQGYFLLFYLLLDVKQMLLQDMSHTEELAEAYEWDENTKEKADYDKAVYAEIYKELKTLLFDAKDQRLSQKVYGKSLLALCKERISAFEEEEWTDLYTMRLVYSLDRNKRLFWSMYSAKEMEEVGFL